MSGKPNLGTRDDAILLAMGFSDHNETSQYLHDMASQGDLQAVYDKARALNRELATLNALFLKTLAQAGT